MSITPQSSLNPEDFHVSGMDFLTSPELGAAPYLETEKVNKEVDEATQRALASYTRFDSGQSINKEPQQTTADITQETLKIDFNYIGKIGRTIHDAREYELAE